ncbi:MAG TPA: radical SAM protein [Candidatus Hydrogenedens sp.]|nr:radical SAM protein [Candidatus Hydrogenedens sp.]
MKKKIILINTGRRNSLYLFVSPPMGVMYLSAYLRKEFQNNIEIKLINQRVENYNEDQIIKIIYNYKPNIIGLSSFTTFAYFIPKISRRIKELFPQAWIVLGGPHASSLRGQVFSDCENLDIVVPGEGEIAFKQIVESYPNKENLKYISGIIWKNEMGEIINNQGNLPIVEDLDNLPIPAYDLIDIQKYWKLQSMTPLPSRKYICLVTSRGCPYRCMWCHSIFGKKIRMQSAEKLVEEIEWLINKYDVNEFEIVDDNFNFNKQRVIQFAELVKKKNLKLKFTFPNALRGDLISEEVAEALHSVGTYMSSFSLETGSPRLQKFTCKNLDITKFLQGVELMVKKGIYANGYCMLGFPTETEEELKMTIDIATNSMLHTASFFTVIPFPGTPLFEWLKQNRPDKVKKINYNNVEYGSIKINLTDLPDEVFYKYQRKAYIKFFSKPKRIYRIIKVYPRPLYLSMYVPMLLQRLVKGIIIK